MRLDLYAFLWVRPPMRVERCLGMSCVHTSSPIVPLAPRQEPA